MSSNRSDLEILSDNLKDLSSDLWWELNPQDNNINEESLRSAYNKLHTACTNFLLDHNHFEQAIVNTLAEAQANTEDQQETEQLLQREQMPSFPPFNI